MHRPAPDPTTSRSRARGSLALRPGLLHVAILLAATSCDGTDMHGSDGGGAADTGPNDAGGSDAGPNDAGLPRAVVFHSDWSTALGASDDALLDTSKALPWDQHGGNGSLNEVGAAAGLGFPAEMANVYANVAEWSGNASQTVYTDQVRLTDGHVPVPAVGESLYYRWYQRYVVPDAIDPTGGVPHGVQDGPAASQTNWMWETPIQQDGTWTPQLNFANANAYPDNRWSTPPLSKGETYRIELHLQRASGTTFIPHLRIYDAGGALVRDDADMQNRDGTRSFADGVELAIEDEALLGGWQIGNNGPSWSNLTEDQFPFDLWYYGGACIRTDDWCGPYADGI